MSIKYNTTLFLLILFKLSLFSQREIKYKCSKNDPNWVKIMYSENPDPGKLIKSYRSFYIENEFQKNQHTQYYKRWLRSFSRNEVNNSSSAPYINRSLSQNSLKATNSPWQSIGPWDFDIDAASSSYAPGAAHVNTVKRCLSDTSIMFAGTATAGVWKSVNAGQNWTLTTQELMINEVFALEIDHSNPNIVYFESGGSLYKSVNGGLNWSTIGDNTFSSLNHSVKDIVLSPQNKYVSYLT